MACEGSRGRSLAIGVHHPFGRARRNRLLMHWPQPSGSPAISSQWPAAVRASGVKDVPPRFDRSLVPRFAACSATSGFSPYRHCMPMQWLGGQTSVELVAADVLGVCLRALAQVGTEGTHYELPSFCNSCLRARPNQARATVLFSRDHRASRFDRRQRCHPSIQVTDQDNGVSPALCCSQLAVVDFLVEECPAAKSQLVQVIDRIGELAGFRCCHFRRRRADSADWDRGFPVGHGNHRYANYNRRRRT
jgi:hypothetical protein